VRVASIVYTRSSGKLTITATVLNAYGQPVSGASVGLRITRSGSLFTSGTWRTNASGKIALTTSSSAPRGCYATTVTSITAAGYAWDGVTPSNGICF
jgi:hypothetical protein